MQDVLVITACKLCHLYLWGLFLIERYCKVKLFEVSFSQAGSEGCVFIFSYASNIKAVI